MAPKFGPNSPDEHVGKQIKLPILQDPLEIYQEVIKLVDKSKKTTTKLKYIDYGIQKLESMIAKGRQAFHELYPEGKINEPDDYWNYDTQSTNTIKELTVLRQKIEAEEIGALEHTEDHLNATMNTVKNNVNVPATQFPELMNSEQAAEYIQMSVSWIRKFFRRESIPHYILGEKTIRFKKGELDTWIMTRREKKHRGK